MRLWFPFAVILSLPLQPRKDMGNKAVGNCVMQTLGLLAVPYVPVSIPVIDALLDETPVDGVLVPKRLGGLDHPGHVILFVVLGGLGDEPDKNNVALALDACSGRDKVTQQLRDVPIPRTLKPHDPRPTMPSRMELLQFGGVCLELQVLQQTRFCFASPVVL
jgi:hypothetical protein